MNRWVVRMPIDNIVYACLVCGSQHRIAGQQWPAAHRLTPLKALLAVRWLRSHVQDSSKIAPRSKKYLPIYNVRAEEYS